MLSLSLNTTPQAQLEALLVLPDHRSGSSWLHASLALLTPSGQFVCPYGPSQLPCCRGVGASSAPQYSVSVLDNATVGCFLLLHAIATLLRENVKLDVDR
mgnify:CR=1 FL=1